MIRHSLNCFLWKVRNARPMRFDRAKLRAADEHLNSPDFHKKLRTGSGALNQAPHYDCSSGMLHKIKPQPIKETN